MEHHAQKAPAVGAKTVDRCLRHCPKSNRVVGSIGKDFARCMRVALNSTPCTMHSELSPRQIVEAAQTLSDKPVLLPLLKQHFAELATNVTDTRPNGT